MTGNINKSVVSVINYYFLKNSNDFSIIFVYCVIFHAEKKVFMLKFRNLNLKKSYVNFPPSNKTSKAKYIFSPIYKLQIIRNYYKDCMCYRHHNQY